MSSIASLGRMISGLNAAQKGLAVTGHNIANLNTPGYIRQQLLQHESGYLNIGAGNKVLQVGLGTSLTEIRQIRDALADKRYRVENSILSYYQVTNSAIQEIETILDEPYGEAISKMLDNFWSQTQKLATNPSGVEERQAFLQSANVLMKKANYIMDSLAEYQENLNSEVIKATNKINDLIAGIRDYNQSIAAGEASGENANDLRDRRNLLLDELSSYIDITYEEQKNGALLVKAEGRVVVDDIFITQLELKQTVPGSSFVKPVWKGTKEDVFSFNEPINSARENDNGKLKALLMARGNDVFRSDTLGMKADGTVEIIKKGTSWEDIALNDNFSVDVSGNSFLVPKVAKKFSEWINELVKEANAAFTGEGIGNQEGKLGVPLFVPIKTSPDGPQKPVEPNPDDYIGDEAGYITAYNTYINEYHQYLEDINSYLIPGNIQVNPELLKDGGYNKLGTVYVDPTNPANSGKGDNRIIEDFLTKWNETRKWPIDGASSSAAPNQKTVDFMDYYNEFVTEIGADGSVYKAKAKEKTTVVNNIESERVAMGGVSQDEEMTNMMKYQYAYNAAARMITVLDGMMDTIINKM